MNNTDAISTDSSYIFALAAAGIELPSPLGRGRAPQNSTQASFSLPSPLAGRVSQSAHTEFSIPSPLANGAPLMAHAGFSLPSPLAGRTSQSSAQASFALPSPLAGRTSQSSDQASFALPSPLASGAPLMAYAVFSLPSPLANPVPQPLQVEPSGLSNLLEAAKVINSPSMEASASSEPSKLTQLQISQEEIRQWRTAVLNYIDQNGSITARIARTLHILRPAKSIARRIALMKDDGLLVQVNKKGKKCYYVRPESAESKNSSLSLSTPSSQALSVVRVASPALRHPLIAKSQGKIDAWRAAVLSHMKKQGLRSITHKQAAVIQVDPTKGITAPLNDNTARSRLEAMALDDLLLGPTTQGSTVFTLPS